MIRTLRSATRLLAVAATLGVVGAGCKGSSPSLSALAITPATATVAIGQTQALAVGGTRSDGSAQVITDATWTTSTAGIATVSAAGVVTGVAAGSATITAASSGLTATAVITVTAPTAPTLMSIAATPATVNLAVGATQALAVTGAYSDDSHAPLTASATFATSKASVATVSAAGLVTAVAAGSATITATVSGKTATVAVTVAAVAPTLSSIAATPATVSLAVGATQALTVTGTYSDQSTAALTSSATFVSAPTSVATVSTAGVVTAVAAGSATITATVSGKTATVAVTVAAAPTLTSIAVTPNPVSLSPGGTAQLVVTGTYSSGPTRDVTANATFTSAAPATATVSAGGLVSAVANGSTTITASVTPSGGSAVTGTTNVNIGTSTSGAVFFAGAYANGVQFKPFGGTDNLSVDSTTTLNTTGHGSLKIVFPAAGSWTGGAFVDATGPRNLTAFDAVTFWAKASAALTFEKVGLANNASPASSGYEVEENGFALTTSWQKFTVPIPLASKLTAINGLFHFADGTNHSPATGSPVAVWLADIQYEALGSAVLGAPAPSWIKTTVPIANAATYQIVPGDLTINYTINSAPITLNIPGTNYFTFTSDNTAVATVSSTGLVTGTGGGTANIGAKLGTVATANNLAVTVSSGQVAAPTTLPPVPAPAVANVISLYSSRAAPSGYSGTAADKSGNVETWLAGWSQNMTCGGSSTPTAGGNPYSITVSGQTANPRKYVLTAGAGSYAGVEFLGKSGATPPGNCGGTINPPPNNELDISGMTHFHIDVWTPDANNVQVQLVDAGADGMLGASKTYGNVTLNGLTTPAFATGTWLSYDVPLAIGSTAFQNGNWVSPPSNLKHVGQLVFTVPNGGTVYVDNLYFYKAGGGGGGGGAPTAPPADPAAANANVMSLFSAKYTGTTADFSARVDSYAASCFGPPGTTVADYTIPGSHAVKQYAIPGNGFAIIELIGAIGGTPTPPDSAICHGGTQKGANTDVSGMTTLHFDVWSPGGSPTNFNVHLVSADSTGTIAGPGAATGASAGSDFSSGAAIIPAGSWKSFDIALSSLGPPGAPAGLNRLALIKLFSQDAGTFFIDNIYFYKPGGGGGGSAPTAPPADPTAANANVMSLFSAKYTGTVGDFSAKVDSYAASCFGPPGTSVADYTIPGSHAVKQYTIPGNSFAIIELIGAVGGTPTPPDSAICHGGTQQGANTNVSGMTTLHFDVWSPGGSPTNFNVHLVNADSTGTIAGPGAATGAGPGSDYSSGASVIPAGSWKSFDIALSSLGPPGAPAGLNRLALIKLLTQDPGTFFIDNLYFYK